MLIITEAFLKQILEACIVVTVSDVQLQVVGLLPPQYIYRLEAFGQSKNNLLLHEVMSFLLRDGAFPRIVDVAIRGIKDNHTLIWIRPSGHAFVRDFSQTWNTPPGMGSFKSIGLMLPSKIWKRPKPYSLQDLIDAGNA